MNSECAGLEIVEGIAYPVSLSGVRAKSGWKRCLPGTLRLLLLEQFSRVLKQTSLSNYQYYAIYDQTKNDPVPAWGDSILIFVVYFLNDPSYSSTRKQDLVSALYLFSASGAHTWDWDLLANHFMASSYRRKDPYSFVARVPEQMIKEHTASRWAWPSDEEKYALWPMEINV